MVYTNATPLVLLIFMRFLFSTGSTLIGCLRHMSTLEDHRLYLSLGREKGGREREGKRRGKIE